LLSFFDGWTDDERLLLLYGGGRNKLEVEEGDENASADGAMCEQQMTSEAKDAAVASEDVVTMV